jgi:hypothetical protein
MLMITRREAATSTKTISGVLRIGILSLNYNGFAVNTDLDSTKVASEEEPMLYCPVCSLRLTERKCKLLCEQCGYYMSCADYY